MRSFPPVPEPPMGCPFRPDPVPQGTSAILATSSQHSSCSPLAIIVNVLIPTTLLVQKSQKTHFPPRLEQGHSHPQEPSPRALLFRVKC